MSSSGPKRLGSKSPGPRRRRRGSPLLRCPKSCRQANNHWETASARCSILPPLSATWLGLSWGSCPCSRCPSLRLPGPPAAASCETAPRNVHSRSPLATLAQMSLGGCRWGPHLGHSGRGRLGQCLLQQLPCGAASRRQEGLPGGGPAKGFFSPWVEHCCTLHVAATQRHITC